MSSQTVYVRRLPISNTEKGATEETQEYFNQGTRSLGSYFSRDSTRPGTGFELWEEKILLPEVLEMSKEDRDYNKAVVKYFHEIYIKIPAHDQKRNVGGLRLEIGLQDNDKELSKDNLPLNVSDYIKYRFLKSHPEVAMSEDEGIGDQLKNYYIYDEAVVKAANKASGNIKDEALQAYISIKENPEKVLQHLVTLNIPRDEYFGKENEVLRRYADVNPKEFLKVHKNPHIEKIALLKDLIEAGILEHAGERFIYKESKNIFAVDSKDALGFLSDPKNSNDVLAFKAKIQAYRKALKG